MTIARIRELSIGVVVGAVLVGGISYATQPEAGAVNACVDKVTGVLRLLGTRACTASETPMSWSVIGPRGASGPIGPRGPVGLTGAQGPSGQTGSQGPSGTRGAQGERGAIGPRGYSGAGGYQAFSANASFVVPAGVTSVRVEAWGGGGSSEGYARSVGNGCPGESGRYLMSHVSVTPGETLEVSIGQGGVPTTSEPEVYGTVRRVWGQPGGATTLRNSAGTTLVSAAGGDGYGVGDHVLWCSDAMVPSSDVTGGGAVAVRRDAPPVQSMLPSVIAANGAIPSNGGPLGGPPYAFKGRAGEMVITW
ncbi:MAG: hypothetical protein KGN78_14310 [Actinomycetales bacterium]|nr:hypothetical protein [Actinomycetales bacterium]